jgi:molybdopterin biosynthesis enzyme
VCRSDRIAPRAFQPDAPPADDGRQPLGFTVAPGDIVPDDIHAVVSSPGLAGSGHGEPGAGMAEPGVFSAPGDMIVPRGKPLSTIDVRLLAELGMRRVPVHRKPRIGIVAIGDQLAMVDGVLSPGQQYDGASPMLAAHITECGGIPIRLGPVPRRPEDIQFAMSKAFEEDDALILAASTGANEGDDLAQILTKMGVEQRFLGLAVSPGCASFFGTARGKPVLLVPSAGAELLSVSELLVTPLVHRLAGLSRIEPRKVGALLEETLRCPVPGVCTVWAVQLKTEGRPVLARPVKGWPGGVVYNAASVHGLCISPDGRDIRAGYSVEVIPVRTTER